MVSIYVKALVITLVLFTGNFFLVKYLDESRAQSLQSQFDQLQQEIQSSQLVLLYSQTLGNPEDSCPILESTVKGQTNRLYLLAAQLREIESANILASTAPLKKRFILENVGLWLYLRQLDSLCGKSETTPVLYFYPELNDPFCVDCKTQAEILNQLSGECKNVRVFAFPTDTDIPAVNLIKNRYGVSLTPSIVANEKLYSGLTSKQAILSQIQCVA